MDAVIWFVLVCVSPCVSTNIRASLGASVAKPREEKPATNN
jgi:hypothetical protein